MAVAEVQEMTSGLLRLGKKKIKIIYLMLLLSFAILLSAGIFMFFYVTGTTPYIGYLLPVFSPALPQYQYSILGEGDQALLKPMDVAVVDDRIYITDTLNSQVQVFKPTGEPVLSFGGSGREPGKFSFPYGIDVAPNGNIFVADMYNGNISIFDDYGRFLNYFAAAEDAVVDPGGLLIKDGLLYVCNLNPGSVLVFDINSEELINTIGSEGTGEGELMFPNDLTFGPDGNLYVSDTGNNRIQVYDPQGSFIKTLPIDGGDIYSPRGVGFDSHGRLHVVSKMNNQIAIFDSNWKKVGDVGDTVFNMPNGIAMDQRTRRVYVTDHISTLVFQ
ncbi:6-bladed beta-propeller [Dethiobacter alkaliphilus]|uniref:NHL repeat containing protein n=1 Tax=Dethiobacter alkaliphilus AHT 1 TaxID=555088 RepID=C0GG46_DETAL|nr:6-bladed beta-propeller [Dethiobacter alkaliphilus]EEG77735.1 NHL repeat containing protein [Dethiobacter alkaliphilus AHT 1]